MLTKFKLTEITEIYFSALASSDSHVYDLEVEDDHSYNIEGTIVHNSGNACSTRIKTGIGYPQLSAVLECADAAHGLCAHIISDGGITCAGDVAKAFAAGADFVMIGSMFAGHDEGLGEHVEILEDKLGNNYVEFYGMSSQKAQENHGSSLKEYRASEGRVLKVPYKGPIANTLQDVLGGIRSCCTYMGATRLKDMPKCATFIRVNQQISTLYGVGQL